MNKSQPDDMLPEYNLEGKKGVRGKYVKAMQKGYSVRVLNEDGTVTVRDFVPIPEKKASRSAENRGKYSRK